MRHLWNCMGWLGIGCLGALGCADAPKRPVIKLPKEEFHVPPEGLFTGPVKYPDELLNTVTPRRQKDDDKLPPPGMGGPTGGGSGMNMGPR